MVRCAACLVIMKPIHAKDSRTGPDTFATYGPRVQIPLPPPDRNPCSRRVPREGPHCVSESRTALRTTAVELRRPTSWVSEPVVLSHEYCEQFAWVRQRTTVIPDRGVRLKSDTPRPVEHLFNLHAVTHLRLGPRKHHHYSCRAVSRPVAHLGQKRFELHSEVARRANRHHRVALSDPELGRQRNSESLAVRSGPQSERAPRSISIHDDEV